MTSVSVIVGLFAKNETLFRVLQTDTMLQLAIARLSHYPSELTEMKSLPSRF
jgi:hypothetical protein